MTNEVSINKTGFYTNSVKIYFISYCYIPKLYVPKILKILKD